MIRFYETFGHNKLRPCKGSPRRFDILLLTPSLLTPSLLKPKNYEISCNRHWFKRSATAHQELQDSPGRQPTDFARDVYARALALRVRRFHARQDFKGAHGDDEAHAESLPTADEAQRR